MRILGLTAYCHDGAAALAEDGAIIAATQKEWTNSMKKDLGFTIPAFRYCLRQARSSKYAIDRVAICDKPLLERYLGFVPKALKSFITAMQAWLADKLYLKSELTRALVEFGGTKPSATPTLQIKANDHPPPAGAFFPSPFERAAVLCLDGVGERGTTAARLGDINSLSLLPQIGFWHSQDFCARLLPTTLPRIRFWDRTCMDDR